MTKFVASVPNMLTRTVGQFAALTEQATAFVNPAYIPSEIETLKNRAHAAMWTFQQRVNAEIQAYMLDNAGGTPQINEIDVSLLTGVQGAWSFENAGDRAEDRSANGNDWEAIAAASEYAEFQGKTVLGMGPNDTVWRTTSDAETRITGALSAHCLYWPQSNANGEIFAYGTFGGTLEADNYLYMLHVTNSTGTFAYHAEYGVNNATGGNFGVLVPVGGPLLASITRDTGGDVKLYLNGVQAGDTMTATTPTGGTTSAVILKESGGVIRYQGDLVIQDVEMTPAEMLALAQQVGVA